MSFKLYSDSKSQNKYDKVNTLGCHVAAVEKIMTKNSEIKLICV